MVNFPCMQKQTWNLSPTTRVSRWGHYGTPVLLFPTAGGDYEEVERFHLVSAAQGLIDAGRMKVFSVDGLSAHTWLRGASQDDCVRAQRAFEAFLYDEVTPLIRRDCQSDTLEIITAGAGMGAFNAVAALCRHPDVFRSSLAMSGAFDVSRYVREQPTSALESVSPLHYVPHLPDNSGLSALRHRFVQIACGEGAYEKPEESRRLAQAFSSRGVPHHLDFWGPAYPHAWPTWRAMVQKYLPAMI